jgi:hypothetical protein
MEKYVEQDAAGQSSIGLQIYVWDKFKAEEDDTEKDQFVYLVPTTSDPPEMGSAPDTIEITEADSPVKQYVSDRPDSPAVELEYNMNSNGYNYIRVKGAISATQSKIYCLLLPLGSAFIIKATGTTWMSGGNPVKGTVSLTQAAESIFVPSLKGTFDEDTQTKLTEWLKVEKSTLTTLADLIAFDSMPVGRETDAVTAAKS